MNQTPHYWHNLNSYFTAFETLHIVFVHKLRQQINKLKVINTKLNIFYVDYTHLDNTSNLKETLFHSVSSTAQNKYENDAQNSVTNYCFSTAYFFFSFFFTFHFFPFQAANCQAFFFFTIFT